MEVYCFSVFCEIISKNIHGMSSNAPARIADVETRFRKTRLTNDKQQLKDMEKMNKTKKDTHYGGKNVLPFSNVPCLCFFLLSLCQVLTCALSIYPEALTGKVNTPLPQVSLSHTHAHYLIAYCDLYYIDTVTPVFPTLFSFSDHVFCRLHSHTCLRPVCLPLSSHW